MITLLLNFVMIFSKLAIADTVSADLALDWKPEPEFGGFYESDASGLYAKEGLKISILPGGAGQPVSQMVAAKKVKFGVASASDVILARAQGAKIVALFAVYQTAPMGFMAHAERKLSSLKDLFQSEGTVALEKGLPSSLWIEKLYGPIKAKIVPYTGGIATFMHDKNFAQQCYITSEPIAAKREGVTPQTFLISDSGYNPYLNIVIVHEDTLAQEEATVKKFVSASRQGWKQYLKDPSKTDVIMQKINTGMDLATFDEAAHLQTDFIQTKETTKSGLGAMTYQRWKSTYDQMVELKLVKSGLDAHQFFRNL